MQFIKNFLREEEGVTAIEYGLLAALIAMVIVGSVVVVGTELDALFGDIGTCLATPNTTNCP